jgi:hypothetical protein
MSIEGSFTVDVQFRDSTTVDGAQSFKTIALQSATNYSSGRVAIVTGTVSTTQFQIDTTGLLYRDAAGQIVDFAPIDGVDRVAFRGNSGGTAPVECIRHEALQSRRSMCCERMHKQ